MQSHSETFGEEVVIYNLQDTEKNRSAEGIAFHLTVPTLKIVKGEKIALIGDSGCGKSTLLDLLAFISSPTRSSGFTFRPDSHLSSADINAHWQNNRLNAVSELRKNFIGYVMQTGGLLPYLSVQENINLSRSVLGLPNDGTVRQLATELKIERHLTKLPSELSIGERQRVAIARALAHQPPVIIADEPTASLDPYSAKTTMNLFIRLVDEMGITLIIASHAWDNLKMFGLKPLFHQIQHLADSTEATLIG